MKPNKHKRTILKMTNPTGAVIWEGKRYEAKQFEGAWTYSERLSEDIEKAKYYLKNNHPNIRVEVIEGWY